MTAKHAGKLGGGCEFLGEVCWGSSGRPGHMAAPGGICIKFIPPPFKIVSSPRPSKTLSDHRRSQCLLSLLFSHLTHTHTHTYTKPFRSLSTLSFHLHKQSEEEKGGAHGQSGCLSSGSCVFKHVCLCLYCLCMHEPSGKA